MSGKLDPPSLPQPAVAFDPSQNATPLPTFDHKTPYEWAAKAHEMEAGIKLISVALTEEQRAALGAVRMKYRPNEDLMVDEQLIAYSGQIFTKPVDVSDRQRRRVELQGLAHLHSNLEALTQRVSDTVLVRTDYQIKETKSYVDAMLQAGDGGDPAGRAAAASVRALIDKNNEANQSKAARNTARVSSAVSDATAELQAQLEASRAEIRNLRAQIDRLVRESEPAPAATPTVRPPSGAGSRRTSR